MVVGQNLFTGDSCSVVNNSRPFFTCRERQLFVVRWLTAIGKDDSAGNYSPPERISRERGDKFGVSCRNLFRENGLLAI
jgi:hypothetical protein